MDRKYKIVYMGTPEYAKEILHTLINAEDMAVSLVITQPDRPAGRKKVLTSPPVDARLFLADGEHRGRTRFKNTIS